MVDKFSATDICGECFVKWQIADLSSNVNEEHPRHETETFSYAGSEWYLRISLEKDLGICVYKLSLLRLNATDGRKINYLLVFGGICWCRGSSSGSGGGRVEDVEFVLPQYAFDFLKPKTQVVCFTLHLSRDESVSPPLLNTTAAETVAARSEQTRTKTRSVSSQTSSYIPKMKDVSSQTDNLNADAGRSGLQNNNPISATGDVSLQTGEISSETNSTASKSTNHVSEVKQTSLQASLPISATDDSTISETTAASSKTSPLSSVTNKSLESFIPISDKHFTNFVGAELSLKNLEEYFEELWNEILNSDERTLQTKYGVQIPGESRLQARASVLSSRPMTLADMFHSDASENPSIEVDTPDVPTSILNDVLNYLFAGTISGRTTEQDSSMYSAALKYAVIELTEKSLDFLISNLTNKNACDAAISDYVSGEHELPLASFRFIAQRLQNFKESRNWKMFVCVKFKLAKEIISKMRTSRI